MNQLSLEKRTKIITLFVEGNSIRGTARAAEVSINTVIKLLVDVGRACERFHDEMVVNLNSKRVECDEQWSFIYSKAKNVHKNKVQADYAGDAWTWLAMDADSRLIISWCVGRRDAESAHLLISDTATRLKKQVQLSTDGLRTYLEAVEDVFQGKISYAQLEKVYGKGEKDGKVDNRQQYVGSVKTRICGNPDMTKVSTSYIERVNLTTRMNTRRLMRKQTGIQKSTRIIVVPLQ